MQIKPYSPGIAGPWDEFVESHPEATIFHAGGWLRAVERTWGHRNFSLYAEESGCPIGILPLFEVRASWYLPLYRSLLVSTPNAVRGGIVARNDSAHAALLAVARRLAVDLQVDYLELRGEDSIDRTLQPQDLYVSFETPIVPDDDAMMRRFPRDIRRMIRLGIERGLTAESGRESLLDKFYELYAVSVRALGTPVFPRRLMANFLREFPERTDILVARDGRRAVGAVFNFYFRETVMPYYAGVDKRYYESGISNFLYWETMRMAARRGYTRFDFGRSKRGTGAYEFKRGWRMEMRPLAYRIDLVRGSSMPSLNPTNPRLQGLIGCWRRLPLSLTKLIGPRVVRNFP